jgi:hypothetical protein
MPQDPTRKAEQFTKNSLFYFCTFYVQQKAKLRAIGF